MPIVDAKTPADRDKGDLVNAHPDLDGTLTLAPEDVMKGVGNFLDYDELGNPRGWRLASPETVDEWDVYIGLTPDSVSRQNTAGLSVNRSFIVNQPIVPGHPPPTRAHALKIPDPLAPLVTSVPSDIPGFAASTPSSPYWMAFSWIRNGRHTLLSNATPFQVGQGQGIRVFLPDSHVEGADGIGVWLTRAGTSTVDAPGVFHLQRELPFTQFQNISYDLPGPFRSLRLAPTRNETTLGKPIPPRFSRRLDNRPGNIGAYYFYATFTHGTGESLPSEPAGPMYIDGSSPYVDTEGKYLAGRGQFRVYKPVFTPSGATGWYPYVQHGGQFYRIWSMDEDIGRARPFPLSTTSVDCAGWTGPVDLDGIWSVDDENILVSATPPDEDTSGIEDPTDLAPDTPVTFGQVLPSPGKYYARITEGTRGQRSVASPVVEFTIDTGEVMKISRQSRVNSIVNSYFTEVGADGLPLGYEILTQNGFAFVGDNGLVIGTDDEINTLASIGEGDEDVVHTMSVETPSVSTDIVRVHHQKDWRIQSKMVALDPERGAFRGKAEVVLYQLDEDQNEIRHDVIAELAARGQLRIGTLIHDVSSSQDLRWRSNTKYCYLKIRFTGDVVNIKLILSYLVLRDHVHGPTHRRPKRNRGVRRYWDEVLIPGDPGGGEDDGEDWRKEGGGGVEEPPENGDVDTEIPYQPAPPPELSIFPAPDRPLSTGTNLEPRLTFDSGLPTGWTLNQSSGTTLSSSSTAALTGAAGLLSKDTGSATAYSYLSKTFPSDRPGVGRHAMGISTKNRMPIMPAGGQVKIHGLARESDNLDCAWLQVGAESEVAEVVIDAGPLSPGNVTVTLDGISYDIAVSAQKEQAQLVLLTDPTAYGTVRVKLNGIPWTFQAGGTYQVESLTIQSPRYNGSIEITLDGIPFDVQVFRGESAVTTAQRIRSAVFPGWTTTGQGNSVIFTATTPGPRIPGVYRRGTSGTSGSITTPRPGESETLLELADRIRSRAYSGWTTAGSGDTIIFNAIYAGVKADLTFSGGVTGATGSVSVLQQGSADSPDTVADKIRTKTGGYSGWTVSGTGATVHFENNTSGFKQDTNFRHNGTLVDSTVTTLRQGRNGDLAAYIRDTTGEIRTRRMITGIDPSAIWNADITVSGAGTSRAVISFWASIGTDTKELLARWEDVDLTDFPVGRAKVGATGETQTSTTYELHVDDVDITNRGMSWYRDHNWDGRLLPILRGYYIPTQPVRNDLFLQDGRFAVLETGEYVLSVFMRTAGIINTARPIVVEAWYLDGRVEELGDISVTGETEWTEYTLPLDEIPVGCYEIRIQSRDIGEGDFRMQEVVLSPGATPLRTGHYATTGSYTAILDISTPNEPSFITLDRLRIDLHTDVDIPDGTTAVITYRSKNAHGGDWSTWYADSTLVPHQAIIQAYIEMTGDGYTSPSIPPGSPGVEYKIYPGGRPNATFLRGDRTEIPGGAAFADLQMPYTMRNIGAQVLPDGTIRFEELFDPVDRLSESTIQIFTPEAYQELLKNWDRPWAVEAWGFVYIVRLSASPELQLVPGSGIWTNIGENDEKMTHGLYQGKMPFAQVLSKKEMISP